MPEGLSFDELNKLYDEQHDGKTRSMSYEQYFGEMDLSREQKQRRMETARNVEDFILLALMTMYYMQQDGGYDYASVTRDVAESYTSLLEELGIPLTAYFSAAHPQSVAAEIVNTTVQNPEEIYNYTIDRAMMIAENEANFIWNDAEFEEAVRSGKTRKRWRAIMDKRTRRTHAEANGQTVPIMEPFEVGGWLLLRPGDDSMGAPPEELVNCRCTVVYY